MSAPGKRAGPLSAMRQLFEGRRNPLWILQNFYSIKNVWCWNTQLICACPIVTKTQNYRDHSKWLGEIIVQLLQKQPGEIGAISIDSNAANLWTPLDNSIYVCYNQTIISEEFLRKEAQQSWAQAVRQLWCECGIPGRCCTGVFVVSLAFDLTKHP